MAIQYLEWRHLSKFELHYRNKTLGPDRRKDPHDIFGKVLIKYKVTEGFRANR